MTETQLNNILQALEQSRILRKVDNQYEISHDSLAKAIELNRTDKERELIEMRRMVRSTFIAFQKTEALLDRKQLNYLNPYLEKLNLENEEAGFIQQSKNEVAQKEKQEKRRTLSIRIGIAIFILFLIGFSSFAWVQWSKAKKAKRNSKKTTNNRRK